MPHSLEKSSKFRFPKIFYYESRDPFLDMATVTGFGANLAVLFGESTGVTAYIWGVGVGW